MVQENLAPTGIRSPDRPARSQSLYRLLYPAHSGCGVVQENTIRAKKIRDFCHLWKRFALLIRPTLRSCFVVGYRITRTCTGLQTVLSSRLMFHQIFRKHIPVFWDYKKEYFLCTPQPHCEHLTCCSNTRNYMFVNCNNIQK